MDRERRLGLRPIGRWKGNSVDSATGLEDRGRRGRQAPTASPSSGRHRTPACFRSRPRQHHYGDRACARRGTADVLPASEPIGGPRRRLRASTTSDNSTRGRHRRAGHIDPDSALGGAGLTPMEDPLDDARGLGARTVGARLELLRTVPHLRGTRYALRGDPPGLSDVGTRETGHSCDDRMP